MKVVEIEGQERLLYKAFPINVVFLRASYADEYGNCTVHREIGPIDVTAMAQACKNSGGRVIVQVEKSSKAAAWIRNWWQFPVSMWILLW